MIKRLCDFLSIISLVFLINVIPKTISCQPPIQYHSSAAYGSPQYQPDSQQSSDLPSSSSFVQSSLQEELVQNQVNPSDSSSSQLLTDNPETPITDTPPNEDLKRPLNNPFVPIEAQPAEKSALECSTKTLTSFMEILDCTSVETYNSDGSVARYGSNDCDFDPQQLCRFYSAPDEELQFRRGIFAHHSLQNNNSQPEFSQFEYSFSSLTKRPLGAVPSKNFLVIAEPFGNTPKADAILQADIRCQVGNGELSFDYWTTITNAVLKVCTRVGQDRRCTSNILYSVDSTTVQVQIVHPEGNSFVVEIIATEFYHPGIFIIDNLKYQADLCEITSESPNVEDRELIARPSPKAFARPNFDPDAPFLSINGKNIDSSNNILTTPPSTEIQTDDEEEGIETTREPINSVPASLVDNETSKWSAKSLKIQKMSESACDILNCNFNNDLCHFSQPELQDNEVMHGKWQTANVRLDGSRQNNSAIGPEGFAFVGMDDRSIKTTGRKVYVLESREFQLNRESKLSFDLYRRSNAISLQICIDSLTNCVYEAPTIRSTSYWKLNETVTLPKETKKVYFVADQLKRFKWLALDNLKLLSDECHSTV